MNLGSHTVVVLRAPAAVDRYGNTAAERDWSTATETTVPGCSVQPAPGGESTDRRNAVTTRWNLWAPAGTDLLATDRVRHGGIDYEVDGEVGVWDFPPLSHVTALLRRVAG